MITKREAEAQDDLMGEREATRKAKEKRDQVLSDLYPEQLKIAVKVEPVTLVRAAYEQDRWCWDWLDEVEANIQLRAPSAKDWMDERKPTGHRRGYKTPERGRKPFEECTQLELQLDIWQKAEMGGDTRNQTRDDIINFKIAFGLTPSGPNGEKLPSWLWSESDDRFYDSVHKQTKGEAA